MKISKIRKPTFFRTPLKDYHERFHDHTSITATQVFFKARNFPKIPIFGLKTTLSRPKMDIFQIRFRHYIRPDKIHIYPYLWVNLIKNKNSASV